MRLKFALMTLAASIPGALNAQINDAAADSDMKPFFSKANACLLAFDTKAKAKKLSVDVYKSALEGACTQEISDLRGLYSLSLERSDSQKYLMDQFDRNVTSARAKMVSDYAMR